MKLMITILWAFVMAAAVQAVPYDRNQARPVNQVLFGTVDSVRTISEQEVVESEVSGWKTLGGALIGGLVGYQFGSGHGRELATVVGALAGGAITDRIQRRQESREIRLVELLIRTEAGQLVNILQEHDPVMLFARGDAVRILYFDEGVRVDKRY